MCAAVPVEWCAVHHNSGLAARSKRAGRVLDHAVARFPGRQAVLLSAGAGVHSSGAQKGAEEVCKLGGPCQHPLTAPGATHRTSTK